LKSYGQGQTSGGTETSSSSDGVQKQAAAFRPVENTNYYLKGAFFKWNFTENKWLNVTDPVYAYVDYTTGVEFEWSSETNAWESKNSPQQQQIESSSKTVENKPKEKQPAAAAAEKREGWFQIDEDKNTNVYVSGLPLDTTDEEFEDMMSKYGIIMKDPLTSKLKLKLYRDEGGEVKGDGRCCYLMPESVKLCLQLLDQSDFRNHRVSVEKAKFEMKGASYDPARAQANAVKKKKLNKSKEKKLIDQQRQKLAQICIFFI
jgi:HIV Tat-specific factor 1